MSAGTYPVLCVCAQCEEVVTVNVPKGEKVNWALNQKCPNCGIAGNLKLGSKYH